MVPVPESAQKKGNTVARFRGIRSKKPHLAVAAGAHPAGDSFIIHRTERLERPGLHTQQKNRYLTPLPCTMSRSP
jgi:hypothetical protein